MLLLLQLHKFSLTGLQLIWTEPIILVQHSSPIVFFFFLPEMELTALRNSLPLLLMHTNEARAMVIHQLNQQHSLFTAFVERTVHKHNFFMIMMIKIMMLWSQGSVACLSLDSCFSMRIKATLLFWSTLSSLDWHCLWESHQGFLQE